MRRAHDGKFLRNEHGRLIGVSLGADFVAEHEWGIAKLLEEFGVPRLSSTDISKVGVERRKITIVPEKVHLVSKTRLGKLIWILVYSPGYYGETITEQHILTWQLSWSDNNVFATAWDRRSFAVLSDREKPMKQLYEAIMKKDACIGLFGGGVFNNAGLSIFIASALPQEVNDQWEKSDKDACSLHLTARETGIVERIDTLNNKHDSFIDKPCGYYSLRPAWIDKDMTSKYKVMFWLNPWNQDKNQYGWYTVEELEQWMEGKGPIVKMEKV